MFKRIRSLVRSLVVCITLFRIFGDAQAQEFVPPIKPGLWKSTVRVVSTFTNGVQGTGTAFLVAKEIVRNGVTNRVYYLVTNKHIVGDWNFNDGIFIPSCKSLMVHYYTKDLKP